jgi:hypothetical protein
LCRSVDSQNPKALNGGGFRGQGLHRGPVVLAKLDDPSGLAIDYDGNLYFSEYVNNRIRHVDAKSKLISTIAGNGLPHRMEIMM